MPEMIRSIRGIASKLGPLLSLGAAGAGTAGNVMANRLRNQPLEQQLALQQKYANMTPTDFASGIQSFLKPMSNALTSSVGNVVQGSLAERGLSEAPGVFADTLSQGLAPFQQQLQQQAINAYFQSLGLPVEAAARFLPTPNTVPTASLWQNLFRQLSGPQMNGLTLNNNSQPGSIQPQLSNMESSIPGWNQFLNNPGAMTPLNSTTGSDAGTMPTNFDWMGVAA